MKRKRKIYFRKRIIQNANGNQYYIEPRELIKNIKEICINKNIILRKCKVAIYSGLSYMEIKCTKKQYDELCDLLNILNYIELC